MFTYYSVSEGLISERELGGIRRKKVNENRRHSRGLDGQKAVILQSGKKTAHYKPTTVQC